MNTETRNEICPWLDETADLLKKLPFGVTARSIAQGAGVPEPWFSKFREGKFKSPNIIQVNKLYIYLKQITNA